MKIKFLNITKEEFLSTQLLHRYMPLEYALKMLNNKQLWFSNPITWKDPFEKRFIEARYNDNGKETDFLWKDQVFCICMTQTLTSEAYWNTYTCQQIGIEFRIEKNKLLDELRRYTQQYDIYIGKVEYMRIADIKRELSKIPFKAPVPKVKSSEWYARLLLLKRIAYRYEDEIRIIIVKKNKTKELGINLDYQCENTELIRSILLDPSIGKNTTDLLKEVFEDKYGFTYLFNSNGHRQSRVLKSQLYAEQKPQKINF